MKLVILLAVVACTYADKLDRTYLPPPGAASAGGSPESLSTPHRPGSSFDQSGKTTNGRESFGVNGPVTSYNHGPQGITGGSNINIQGSAVTDFGTPSAGDVGHSSRPSHTAHPVDGSVNPAFGNGQTIFNTHDDNNQNYGNQDSTRPERPQAAADKAAETIRYDSEIDGDSFAYSFETSNGISAEENGVATNGVQAQGGFSYVGDDGQQYKVTYTANENGYLPQGDHLPTPPPIPDEILKSIEENAKAAASGTQEGAYHEDDTSSTFNGPTKGFIQYNTNTQIASNVQTSQPGNKLSQSEHQNQYDPSSLGSTATTGHVDFPTLTRPSSFGQSSLSNQQNVGSHSMNIGQQQIPTSNQQTSQTGYNYNRPAASQSFDSRPTQTQISNKPQQNNFATSSPGNEIYQYNAPKAQSQNNGPESQNAPNYQNSQSQRPQYVAPKSQIPQYSAPKSQVPQAQNSQFTHSQQQESKYIAPRPQTTQFTPSRPQGSQYVAPTSQTTQNTQSLSPQYNAPKAQFSQYSSQNQGSSPKTPQYTSAPKYQGNQNIPQSQSPKYTAPQQQTPQYSAPSGQNTQFNAPNTQSPQYSPARPQYNPSSLGTTSTTGHDDFPTPTRPSSFGQSSPSGQQNVGSHSINIGQQQIPTFKQQTSQTGYNYNRPAASQSFDSRPTQTKVSNRPQQNDFVTSSPGNKISNTQFNAPSTQSPQYSPSRPQNQYSAPNGQNTQFNAPNTQSPSRPQNTQPQSPNYTASKQQSAPNGQNTQFNAPNTQSSQYSPSRPQNTQPQSPNYTAPKQQISQYSALNGQNTQFNAPNTQSPQYSPARPQSQYSAPSGQNTQFNAPNTQSPQYSPARPQSQYSAPNGQNTQFNAPNTQSPQYSPAIPQSPQYNAPQPQSPKYTAPKPQSGSSRPQIPQYIQQQPQSTQFVPSQPQPTQQYASNKGYQYNAPTGQTFEESRPSFNNQLPNTNGSFGSQGQKSNNGYHSSPQTPSGSLGGSTAQYQPATTSPTFVPLGQKTQTPGEDFTGPRQPPSFSPEEGYRY